MRTGGVIDREQERSHEPDPEEGAEPTFTAPPPSWVRRLAGLTHELGVVVATVVCGVTGVVLGGLLVTLLHVWQGIPLLVALRLGFAAGLVTGLLVAVPAAVLLRLVDDLVTGRARLEEEIRRRRRVERALRRLADVDPLTGLYNRRAFLERARQIADLARRHGFPLSMLILDVDRFKRINDSAGHAVGDEVLRRLGEVVRRALRRTDIAARFGGDEFVVLLPYTDVPGAREAAERIRRRVRTLEGPARFTVSVGVATVAGADALIENLLTRADRALYRAKEEGRDRVAVAEPPRGLPPPPAGEGGTA